ncbi:MAG: hypothetical protein PWP31_833 [Clostridia bacterium]|nr:hypothetical protein [Clostridia bacterium]
MMEYMTTQEAAEKRGVTVRRVQVLCAEGRIEGAIKRASVWFISKEAEKPVDSRTVCKSPRKK